MARKDRQLQDAGPAPWLLEQPIKPFQLQGLHGGRCSSYGTAPHVKTAADPQPEAMATGPYLLDPQLLAWRPKTHKHQLRLLLPQLRFHHGPVVRGLVAVDEVLQAKVRVAPPPESGRGLQTVVPCPHPGHPPAEGSGTVQQHLGQFNAGLSPQPTALEPQRPDHPGTVRNHQVGPLDHPAEGGMAAGGHGHLGVQGHHVATPADQTFRCPEQVRGQVDRETQHLPLPAFTDRHQMGVSRCMAGLSTLRSIQWASCRAREAC